MTVCLPACRCGKHQRKVRSKCLPDCNCKRHEEFSEDRKQRISESKTGKGQGWYVSNDNHKYLTGMWGHPLAIGNGVVAEHRHVLYEKIGPGTHPCHWCGALRDWGGLDGINADHLDSEPLNNAPENLVPSCCGCNWVGRRRLSRREGIA